MTRDLPALLKYEPQKLNSMVFRKRGPWRIEDPINFKQMAWFPLWPADCFNHRACGSAYRIAIAKLSGLEEQAPMEVLLAAKSSISPPGEEITSGGRDWPFAT